MISANANKTNVFLPVKIKSLIVRALTEQTQKNVSLQELKFSIFKGLVLRNLAISDGKTTLISLKEASCAFLLPAIFQKKIIIPFINLDSGEIFLERRKDSTFNLQDLFAGKTAAAAKPAFSLFVYRVTLANAVIHFKDNALAQPFEKKIENINATLNLSLSHIRTDTPRRAPIYPNRNHNRAPPCLL